MENKALEEIIKNLYAEVRGSSCDTWELYDDELESKTQSFLEELESVIDNFVDKNNLTINWN